MRIAICQMSNANSIENNLEKSLNYIIEASNNKADLILFPEVQLTEFFPQYEKRNVDSYKISIDSDIVKSFSICAKENNIIVVPNVYLLENRNAYDASILINNDGSVIGVQKMVHVAQAEKFYEQDYYTPSDEGFKVFDTEFGNIGIVVCFDRHYPESIRTESLMGADLILIPTVNTKSEPNKMFEIELQAQAFQNSVSIVMCNRVGVEDEMEFSGESIAIDANGETILKADDQEQLIYIDLDLKETKIIRDSKNYTQFRKKEFYE